MGHFEISKGETFMNNIVDLRNTGNGLDVEFEVIPVVDIHNVKNERQRKIIAGTAEVNERLSEVQDRIAVLNADIDRLTNHADGIDYSIAVISGIITGIIDATIVGEWNISRAKSEAHEDVENKVVKFAKKQPDYIPYCNLALEGKGNPRRKPKNPDLLDTAVEFLEWKFHLPGDGAYSTGKYGIDGSTHRLDDLCHHPTIVGLICCVIVQFTGNTLYVNKYGEDISIPITVNDYGNFVGKNPVTKLFAGVINWFITCAKTIANRKGHLMSDIATSASLPGSFLSTITELASIPCFRNEEFLTKLRDAFTNGIGTGDGQVNLGVFNKLFEDAENKFNIITEKAAVRELKRQAIPVVINEILVRASYFIRRMIRELKEKQDVKLIEWKNVIPLNNRTIVRMMTIATGTFTAIDLADAAIRSATKSVDLSTFFSNMILRVNFVGVGRFAVAIGVDVGMGLSKGVKRNKRIKMQSEQMHLLNAKVYYKQAEMWMAAESTEATLDEAYSMIEETIRLFVESVYEINASLNNIGEMTDDIKQKNPGLIEEIQDVLKWGVMRRDNMTPTKIAIICDGKEISFGLNLFHLFLFKNEKDNYSSKDKGEVEIELYSLATYRHSDISDDTIRVFINNTKIVDSTYSTVFDEYGMTIYRSAEGYVLKADDKHLSGNEYIAFLGFANRKAEEYSVLEESYLNQVLSLNASWIARSFVNSPSGGVFVSKKHRLQQQFDCLAFVFYLDVLKK